MSDELGCSLAQLSLAWILLNPNVSTVITGASRVEQIHENMKAIDVVQKITPEIKQRIEEIVGRRVRLSRRSWTCGVVGYNNDPAACALWCRTVPSRLGA